MLVSCKTKWWEGLYATGLGRVFVTDCLLFVDGLRLCNVMPAASEERGTGPLEVWAEGTAWGADPRQAPFVGEKAG